MSTRLYFLKQLKRAGLATKDLLLFYLTFVRPVTEYACQVFHNSLTKYLSDDLENDIVQNTSHKLHALLPEENRSGMNLTRKSKFNYPVCKTNRFQNSFIMANVKDQYI